MLRCVPAGGTLATVVGCGGGWDIDLPDDYKLVAFDAFEAAIVGADKSIIVDPHVVEYSVVRGS